MMMMIEEEEKRATDNTARSTRDVARCTLSNTKALSSWRPSRRRVASQTHNNVRRPQNDNGITPLSSFRAIRYLWLIFLSSSPLRCSIDRSCSPNFPLSGSSPWGKSSLRCFAALAALVFCFMDRISPRAGRQTGS